MGIGYDWRELAHTHNGYDIAGGFEECADVAKRVRDGFRDDGALEAFTTDELRMALFFSARAERHQLEPREETPFEDAIVLALVKRVGREELDREVGELRERWG